MFSHTYHIRGGGEKEEEKEGGMERRGGIGRREGGEEESKRCQGGQRNDYTGPLLMGTSMLQPQ